MKLRNFRQALTKIHYGNWLGLHPTLKPLAMIVRIIRASGSWYSSQWSRGYFVGISTLSVIYFVMFYVGYNLFGEELGLFENFRADDWEKRRSLGLTIAGVLGPWLAIIGYYLAARRTQAIQQDNLIKSEQTDQDGFARALELIDRNGVAAMGAIDLVAEIGIRNRRYCAVAKHVLKNLIERHGAIPTIGSDTTRKTDDYMLHIQSALNGLCRLQNSIEFNTNEKANQETVRFHLIDFSRIRATVGIKMEAFAFEECSFLKADLGTVTFDMTMFVRCDLSDASLEDARFIGGPVFFNSNLFETKMHNTEITGADFSGIRAFSKGQLASCRYWKRQPPVNLPRQIDAITLPTSFDSGLTRSEDNYLPPPYEMCGENGEAPKNRYMTRHEAESFWDNFNSNCRPLDRERNLIPIIYPEEIED